MTDVKLTEARLARARAQQVAATTDYRSSLIVLARLLGYLPQGDLALPDTTSLHGAMPGALEDGLKIARDRSPILKALDKEILAAGHDIDAQRYGLRPSVTAFASLSKQYDPQPGIIDDAMATTVGVRAKWVVFDGQLTKANIRTARALKAKREQERLSTERQLTQHITQLWQVWQDAKTERGLRAQQVVASSDVTTGIKAEADMGERSQFDVLNSEEDMLEAQAAYVRAQATEKSAALRLAVELGVDMGGGV